MTVRLRITDSLPLPVVLIDSEIADAALSDLLALNEGVADSVTVLAAL